MAEFFNYPGPIFCIIPDTDIARPWVPLNPSSSRIKYLTPTERVSERLKLYGIKEENIFFTGFPLPAENIGTEKLEVLKNDLRHRLLNLDPEKKYFKLYKPLIEKYLGFLPEKSDHPLTITFAVGGAGAQKEIGIDILKSLRDKIIKGELRVILVAGVKERVKEYFLQNIQNLNLKDNLGDGVDVIYADNIEEYFEKFNLSLRKTDILWTKPSELSFYTALGLPLIIAPTIGSQEDFNKEWLLRLGSGILQKNPIYTDQWLLDLLQGGWFAEAAMQGFVEAKKRGIFEIEKVMFDLQRKKNET